MNVCTSLCCVIFADPAGAIRQNYWSKINRVAVEGRVKILSLHLLLLIFVCQQSSCPERFNHPGSCPESENKSETKKNSIMMLVDNVNMAQIAGQLNWMQLSFAVLPPTDPSTHLLECKVCSHTNTNTNTNANTNTNYNCSTQLLKCSYETFSH